MPAGKGGLNRRMVLRALREKRLAKRLEAIDGQVVDLSPGRNKYHQQKTVYLGETYDSLGEAECAAWLEMRRKAGELVEWWRPKPFLLADRGCRQCTAGIDEPCVDRKGNELKSYHRARHATTYKPDFGVIPQEPFVGRMLKPIHGTYYIDYKGSHVTETEAWRLKMHLWAKWVPHELRVVTKVDGAFTERVVCTGWTDEVIENHVEKDH